MGKFIINWRCRTTQAGEIVISTGQKGGYGDIYRYGTEGGSCVYLQDRDVTPLEENRFSPKTHWRINRFLLHTYHNPLLTLIDFTDWINQIFRRLNSFL